MQILLFILKILGITVLGILGLALFLLLLVLFWPVGFQAGGSYHGQPYVRADVGWLFRMLHLKVVYENGEITKKLTLFGFPLKKREKKQKKKKESRKRESRKKESEAKVPKSELVKPERAPVEAEMPQPAKLKASFGEETFPAFEDRKQPELEVQCRNRKKEAGKKKEEKEKAEKKEGFIMRIEKALKKLLSILKKPPQLLKGLIKKLRAAFYAAAGMKRKLCRYYEFLTQEENRTSFGYLWGIIKKLGRHCSPRRVKGYVRFGMEDPCTTGEILAVAAVFYGRYGKNLKLFPDFEQKCLDAELSLRGHIQIGVIGFHALRMLFSREFRSLKHNFDQLKEES